MKTNINFEAMKHVSGDTDNDQVAAGLFARSVTELCARKCQFIVDLYQAKFELCEQSMRQAKDAKSTLNQLAGMVEELDNLHEKGKLGPIFQSLKAKILLDQKQGEINLLGLNEYYVP